MTVIVYNMNLPKNCMGCDFIRIYEGRKPYCTRSLNNVDDLSIRQEDCQIEDFDEFKFYIHNFVCRDCRYIEYTADGAGCRKHGRLVMAGKDYCSWGMREW